MSKPNHLARKVTKGDQIPFLLQWVQHTVAKALEGGPVQITLSRVSKSRNQEAKYHAMIKDIHQQCFRGYSFDGVKAVLVNQFAHEMEQAGTPLAHPGETVWDWKLQQRVTVRPSTKKFRKAEAADFIEFLHSVGAEYDVQWSDRSLAVYDEMMEGRAA